MAQINIDSAALDELNSAETRTLFDAADKLSSLGVGRIVNLPQIIVVGDQSSGKSSVLEAISHVHFPVQGGVCTRFATELVLRPSSRRCVTASVRFADSNKPGHSLQIADFNHDDISKIISDAKEVMGISDKGRDFSEDVLRLEIEGPDMYPLTLVDLPGIFHNETATQSAEGMRTVKKLVESYMKKPNSIILTVIAANNQLANQVVMRKAETHDPTKTRTLGVITKPDLLPPGSSNENEYLQVVRGRDTANNLRLGWHVLRNRADYEEDIGPRDTVEEEFFKSGAWASIPAANRGVAALRSKLSHILHDHIKGSLPAVLDDIQAKLSEREVELEKLGIPRSTTEDMRAYLIDIAGNFQRLVHDGIRGHYNDPFFGGFNGRERKLRSRLRNFNRAIRHLLLTCGAAQEVIGRSYGPLNEYETPGYLSDLLHSYYDDIGCPEYIDWKELTKQLEDQAAANQGTEFPGYANMDIVIQLFQKQAQPWQKISEVHLEKVMGVVKAFVDEAFEHIIGPSSSSSTTSAILSTSVDQFFDEKEKVLSAKLKEILRPFKEGYALPLDADFHEAMKKTIAERTAAQNKGGDGSDLGSESGIASYDGNDFGIERVVDTMQTFYDMALRTFTDNLINLAIESCLIQDLPAIFTPKLVNRMDNERLAELAAESEEIRNYRSQLREDIKLLKQGLEQCRRYKPRGTAALPPSTRVTPPTPRQHTPTPAGSKSAGSTNLSETLDGKVKASAKGSSPKSTTPAPSKVPPSTGLFGSSPVWSSSLKEANKSTNPFASFGKPVTSTGTGKEAISAFGAEQPSGIFASSATSLPSAKKGTTEQPSGGFGGFGGTASGSTATPPKGIFGGLGTASPSSSSSASKTPFSGVGSFGSSGSSTGGGLFGSSSKLDFSTPPGEVLGSKAPPQCASS